RPVDGDASRGDRPDEYREPGGILHAGIGHNGDRSNRLALAYCHRPRPEDDPEQRRPDISRAHDLFDWKPRTMLKDGLARTIAYFDQWLSDQKLRTQLMTPSA